MDARQGASIIALVLNVCEHLTLLPEEVEYIWQRPWRSRVSSWIFIFTRYGPYLIHTLNPHYMDPSFDTTDPDFYGFFAFSCRLAAAQSMFLAIHFILAKRLTLFYPGVWVRVFILPGFLFARVSMMFGLASIGYHSMVVRDAKSIGPNEIMTLYAGGEVVLESLMLGFMVFAHFASAGRGRNPLTYRLRRREGVGVPAFGLAALAIVLVMQYMGPPISLAIFSLYLGVMSALACRLILSNHKAIRDAPPAEYRLVNLRL